MSFWVAVNRVLNEADVILVIIDARMPELSYNKEIHEKIEKSKKMGILVYNKSDLVSKKKIDSLRNSLGKGYFVSKYEKSGIQKLKKDLIKLADNGGEEYMKIGVVGYPNTGKSSVINALTGRGRATVSNVAGTTKGIQWVIEGKLKFLDSPGVIPFRDGSSKLGLLGAKNAEKLKDPQKVAHAILRNFIKANKEALEEFYGINVGEDIEKVFNEIGKKRRFLSKGGVVDEMSTATTIIRDWHRGKLKI